jgi:hypothetical protein
MKRSITKISWGCPLDWTTGNLVFVFTPVTLWKVESFLYFAKIKDSSAQTEMSHARKSHFPKLLNF